MSDLRTVAEAAKHWVVSDRTLRRLVNTGAIAAVKDDDDVTRIAVTDLDARYERRPDFTLIVERLDALGQSTTSTGAGMAERLDANAVAVMDRLDASDGRLQAAETALGKVFQNLSTQHQHVTRATTEAATAIAEANAARSRLVEARQRSRIVVVIATTVFALAGVLVGLVLAGTLQNAQVALTAVARVRAWFPFVAVAVAVVAAIWALWKAAPHFDPPAKSEKRQRGPAPKARTTAP